MALSRNDVGGVMNTYNLTYVELANLEERLERKNKGFMRTLSVSRVLGRVRVEMNYKKFYGGDYESRGIKKAIYR